MRHIFWRHVIVSGTFLLLLFAPLAIEAQPGENEIPVLLSTGLPTTDTPEEALPQGAVVYLRANNLLGLMEDIDSLLTSFVPKKALSLLLYSNVINRKHIPNTPQSKT